MPPTKTLLIVTDTHRGAAEVAAAREARYRLVAERIGAELLLLDGCSVAELHQQAPVLTEVVGLPDGRLSRGLLYAAPLSLLAWSAVAGLVWLGCRLLGG